MCIFCLVVLAKNAVYQDVSVIFKTTAKRTETKYIIVHHTANCEHFTIGEVDDYHTHKGWGSGFGYNFFIQDHKVFKVKDADSPTANALNHNYDAVAICVDGDFDEQEPDAVTIAELWVLIKYLKIKYPNAQLISHSDVNETKCCGENLKRIIHEWKK